jgi:hypothetical protein
LAEADVEADVPKSTLLTYNRLAARKDGTAQQRIIDSLNGIYGISA